MYPLFRYFPYHTILKCKKLRRWESIIPLTNVLAPCGCGLNPVRPSFHAVAQGEWVVEFAHDLATVVFYGLDGAFRCSRRGDVNRFFEVLRTLDNLLSAVKIRYALNDSHISQDFYAVMNIMYTATEKQLSCSNWVFR